VTDNVNTAKYLLSVCREIWL